MSSKTEKYIIESLAASGIAVVDAAVAYRLRPDLSSSPLEAAADWGALPQHEALLDRLGVQKFVAQLEDAHGRARTLRLGARSAELLDQRLEWLLGWEVTEVRPVQRFFEAVRGAPQPVPAGEDAPPPYQCQARSDWFSSRNLKDPEAEAVRTARRPAVRNI